MEEEGQRQGLVVFLCVPRGFTEQNLDLLPENSPTSIAVNTFQWQAQEGKQLWRYCRPTGPEILCD